MKVFLDLDGVLVNWSGGLCQLMNIDPNDPEALEILQSDRMLEGGPFGTREEVEVAVQDAGYDFWMDLELLPWADRVIEICKKYNLYFLTSPASFHAGAHAKLDYIWKHFKSDNVILTKHKYLCANPEHILIDDMKFNIVKWNIAGGQSFHWPCQWKLLKDPSLVEQTLRNLENFLLEKNKNDSQMQLQSR